MRPFDTLIRLSENDLDDKRKNLAALEDVLSRAVARREALDEELAQEQRIAAEDPAAARLYGSYAERVIERREQADAALAEATRAVEEAREIVREAFAELRRYELAHEQRLEKLRREQAAKEQVELDEIAGNLLRSEDDRL